MTTDGDMSKAPGSPKGSPSGVDEGEFDGHPRPDAVASRADGRPPAEAGSEDPDEQAQVILEESEDRMAAGAAKADPGTDGHDWP
jgi:hypothetical protein